MGEIPSLTELRKFLYYRIKSHQAKCSSTDKQVVATIFSNPDSTIALIFPFCERLLSETPREGGSYRSHDSSISGTKPKVLIFYCKQLFESLGIITLCGWQF